MTVGGLLARNARDWPERVGLEEGGRSWTFAQWNARVNRLAHAFLGDGIGRGTRVALLSHNREELVTAYLATQKIAAVPVPMNFRLASGEIAHILDDSGARMLILETDLAGVAAEAAAGRPDVALLEIGGRELPGARDFETFLAAGGEAEPGVPVGEDDVACFLYTSGTTGRPKGVVHTHAAHVALSMGCVMEYGLARDERALNIAPVYHVAGMQSWFLPHLYVGATNVLLRRYDPEAAVRATAEAGITSLYAVPTQVVTMLLSLNAPGRPGTELGGIPTAKRGSACPAASGGRAIDGIRSADRVADVTEGVRYPIAHGTQFTGNLEGAGPGVG